MTYFLTQKRFKELERELGELKTNKRLEVAEQLRQAKELGDLSENSEYLEAREKQTRLELQIAEIEEILRGASIIKGGQSKEKVEVGSTVEVLRDKKHLKFVIVGSEEAKPEEGFISNESPLGQELLGSQVGDSVEVKTPVGSLIQYKIQKIN
ncbi:MAG: transcription elongation factor GreA [Candidatus Colwellbacteria bacterium]|nr:transcription elongation factor GreA [Candidatus Colwellbacteria bacterium]